MTDHFNTDWFFFDSNDFHGHLDTRDLLDTVLSGENEHKSLQTIYDAADHIDIQDAISADNAQHQHLDDVMDERHPRRKRTTTDTEEMRRRKQPQKPTDLHWTRKNTYLFLLVWNFIMLTLYKTTNFLHDVPLYAWYFIIVLHISAIGIYLYDVISYWLKGRGLCKPSPIHSV
jgi:hypothetical protein